MNNDELRTLFDQQAPVYDQQWAKMAPIRDALHFLMGAVLANLRADARILCVGVGTGAELAHLAASGPGFRFTAVDPSGAMIAECRRRAEASGFAERCDFHVGYVETLPDGEPHDAATSLLVSQFILDEDARRDYFAAIARRLAPSGVLVCADLAAESESYDALLRTWLTVMTRAGVPAEALERARAAYARDVAILPPDRVARLIAAGGFASPVGFFQAGLMHAWHASRLATGR